MKSVNRFSKHLPKAKKLVLACFLEHVLFPEARQEVTTCEQVFTLHNKEQVVVQNDQ